jgi:hypothetical protein
MYALEQQVVSGPGKSHIPPRARAREEFSNSQARSTGLQTELTELHSPMGWGVSKSGSWKGKEGGFALNHSLYQ